MFYRAHAALQAREIWSLARTAPEFEVTIEMRSGCPPNVSTQTACFAAPVLWLGPAARFLAAPRSLFGSRPLLPGFGVVIAGSPEDMTIAALNFYLDPHLVGVFASVMGLV